MERAYTEMQCGQYEHLTPASVHNPSTFQARPTIVNSGQICLLGGNCQQINTRKTKQRNAETAYGKYFRFRYKAPFHETLALRVVTLLPPLQT
jgi:hypothetical protein